eukprot:1989456-Rhodomonas_salina.2
MLGLRCWSVPIGLRTCIPDRPSDAGGLETSRCPLSAPRQAAARCPLGRAPTITIALRLSCRYHRLPTTEVTWRAAARPREADVERLAQKRGVGILPCAFKSPSRRYSAWRREQKSARGSETG